MFRPSQTVPDRWRSGRKKSKDGQEAHSKLKKEVKKGSGSVRMARSIIPAMPRCSPGGRASSPQGASPQCASNDCGTYLARSGWAGTCCSPGHHSARSPPPCTPLPATGRGKVAEHVRKSCALSRRRLATPSRESSAPPARPGEAGPSEAPARRRRAPYDLQGRPEGLPSRSATPAAKARPPGVQERSGPSGRGWKLAADLRPEFDEK